MVKRAATSRRALALQAVAVACVAAFLAAAGHNIAVNLQRQGIASGFGFLGRNAGFDIIQTLIEFSPGATYGRAFLVALLNTLLVSVLGIVFGSILGFSLGVARLSRNFLLSRLALAYVEVVRNVPLLLHLFFWYFAALRSLPEVRASYSFFELVFINNRGLYIPWFDSVPKLEGFNFEGGVALIPELIALVVALSTYTAAFIAEIVRAGILAVPKGQHEAAESLGLSRAQALRLVVLPQAMRVVVPPLTSQYLNLIKNSSLAAAIAYPDLVLVFAGTVLTQTGQAVEVIGITMAVYLVLSLMVSFGMNAFNRRFALEER